MAFFGGGGAGGPVMPEPSCPPPDGSECSEALHDDLEHAVSPARVLATTGASSQYSATEAESCLDPEAEGMPTLLQQRPELQHSPKDHVKLPQEQRDKESGLEVADQPAKGRSRFSERASRVSRSFFSEKSTRFGSEQSFFTDAEEEEEGLETTKWCWCKINPCSGEGMCHCCYLLTFVMFVLFVPLFLKWMVSAPKPPEFWYPLATFPFKFPLLLDWQFVQLQKGNAFGLWMSPIPSTPTSCNFSSCSGDSDTPLTAATEMNFEVTMKLEAPQFNHTAYPVLLASDDFLNWNVVADKRQSYPKQYFPSHSALYGHAYNYVSEKCTRPPEVLPGMPAPSLERFSEVPTYILVCITWSSTKVNLHRTTNSIKGSQLGIFCDAVGGVGGWPCQNVATNLQLPGCSADGILSVNNYASTVAGIEVQGAEFSGTVSLRGCLPGPTSEKCITSGEPLSRWPCQKCYNQSVTERGGGDNMTLLYDSLPAMEVILQNATINQDHWDTMGPQAYILTSPLSDDGLGADGFGDGVFKTLYDYDVFPLPVRVDELPDPSEVLTTAPPTFIDESRNAMRFEAQNKVTIQPEWCFGTRGPLYLVSCVVNTSTHIDNFNFMPGQQIGKPPFNDRCLAVTGRCGHACTTQKEPMQYCNADGTIPQSELVGDTETKKNDEIAVYLFVWTLMIGFAVKVWYYFPGIFTPYKRAEFYFPKMTEQIKYMAVCAPSGGETKACILRNVVGALSTLPTDCQCPFHVIFCDEGHRHSHKIMFRVFVEVMGHVPDICVNAEKKSKRIKHGYKERNLKTFTTCWVEATRKFKLEECTLDKTVKKIKDLEAEGAPGSGDKIGKLKVQIDALSGVAALKMLQDRHGWPKGSADAPGTPERLVLDLENALLQLRKQLTCGENTFEATGSRPSARDVGVPVHLDDYEDYGWLDPHSTDMHPKPLYNLHYIARAKPIEDERKIKVQHVAQGVWCYSLPKKEDSRQKKTWLQWRQHAEEFIPGEDIMTQSKYLVPVRTSRGKAGGLNFVENYLFDFHCRYENPRAAMEPVRFKHAIFSIADARHQYQPDFFVESLPYFFRKDNELNPKVAFAQCPQYFQEMPDEADYLDTNNSSFFRLGCMLRNCCGGVSSCGTNGTWLIRDRRAGSCGSISMWEEEDAKEMDQGFTQVVERRFFHESCKVEDTASSLQRVVKGKISQYVNMRLSYGMAKAPTDYLAAIQRWAEGGVVLMLQTFLGSEQGVYMIWITFALFLTFVTSLIFVIHSRGPPLILGYIFRSITGDDRILDYLLEQTTMWAEAFVPLLDQPESSVPDYQEMFYQVVVWAIGLAIAMAGIALITSFSYFAHHSTCCGRRRAARRTRFPTCLAQWARLMITMDNITYYFWCWTAFFWVGFNYYSVWAVKTYNFYPGIMSFFSWGLALFNYGLLISASGRYKMAESTAANEVFVLTLTNIWRTTQLFYITAPLTVYSIIMGTLDFSRNRMFGEDISYWTGGDRGAVSKSIVQWWTLLLVSGTFFTWLSFLAGWLPQESNNIGSLLIVTFIGLDVVHPCAFLWLGSQTEPLPTPDVVAAAGLSGQMQRCCRRVAQLLLSMTFWRNCLRGFIFSPRFTGFVKWVGPLNQCLVQPILTLFFPVLGINQALLLLSTK